MHSRSRKKLIASGGNDGTTCAQSQRGISGNAFPGGLRALSDTFAGIRPADAPGFIVAQFAGGIAATLAFRWLVPSLRLTAKDVTLPHDPAADQH
jgi:hypothetical protein